ncbi:MAG: GFA family protein, partial [Burkholderiales bacterium]
MSFEVDVSGRLVVHDCNCSICRRAAYLHLIVPRDRFRLLQGEGNLATYTFNTGVAQHYFCKTCGIKSFYIPRSNPDCY